MLTTQTNKETHCKCSQHNQIVFVARFFVWLCCEYLQCVSLFVCRACVVKWMKLFSEFASVFSICSVLSSLCHRSFLNIPATNITSISQSGCPSVPFYSLLCDL